MNAAGARWLLGVGALFSGVALVTHILFGASLPLVLGVTVSLLALTVAVIGWRSGGEERARHAQVAMVGLGSGLIATIAYDGTKFLLSGWNSSPYNPFEAIRVFGSLLVGSASPAWIQAAGLAFHLLNGIAFGVSYGFLFTRHGALTGIGWGLCLELFQLTLYPGWLDIRTYREFAQISALGHIAYGAVLGGSVRWGLARFEHRAKARR